MPTNLPVNTEESIKRDRTMNKIILLFIGIFLGYVAAEVKNYYVNKADTKSNVIQTK